MLAISIIGHTAHEWTWYERLLTTDAAIILICIEGPVLWAKGSVPCQNWRRHVSVLVQLKTWHQRQCFLCVISSHHLMMSHSMSRFAQLQWSFEFWIGTRPRFTSSSWWLRASDRTGWSCARGHWCDAAVLTRVFLMFDRDCLLLTASFYKSVLITLHVIHRLQVNLRNLAILLSWWSSSCSTFRSLIC